MRLDEYIEKSLADIAKEVTCAQWHANVSIAPARIEGRPIFEPQFVKSEIEVTTSIEGGGKINVLSLAELNAADIGRRSHRIVFEVPVHFNSTNVYPKGEHT